MTLVLTFLKIYLYITLVCFEFFRTELVKNFNILWSKFHLSKGKKSLAFGSIGVRNAQTESGNVETPFPQQNRIAGGATP